MSGMWKRLPGYISYESKRRFFGLKNAKVTNKKDNQPNENNWLKYRGPDAKKIVCNNCGALISVDGPQICWSCNPTKLED